MRIKGKQVLITGGMGFIGSNLAIQLVAMGAQVTIIDAMLPDYGGNKFNIEPVKNDLKIIKANICDESVMNGLVKDQACIFHLAGQVCHVLSLTDPFLDIEYNIRGTAVLLEACRKYNPGARIVYTGTRGQYGPAISLPVTEDAPTNPTGMYELSNLTAEKMIKIYNDRHGMKAILLRLTNIYGPRAQMKHDRYCVVNWFIRQAIENKTIKIFGNGQILRDYLYIDDCVEGIIGSSMSEAAVSETFNLASGHPVTFVELAETIVQVAKAGKWAFAPFSRERKLLEPGDFYADIKKIERIVGWKPKTPLAEGIERTVDFYQNNKRYYW